ncbi:MAG: hypothetical protein ACRD6X_03860 [Pyrinomonadaceae bacterium]
MKNIRFKGLIAALVVSTFAVMLCAGVAAAQGRWSTRYNRGDIGNIIKRLEESSDQFRNDFDRAIDDSRLNGTSTERQWENTVQNYENSLDDLRKHFDRNDSWWESRSRVQTVITRARPVNTIMNTVSFRRNLERQWNRMRGDLNTLADTYDLPGINGGYTGGGGGAGQRPPNWAVGTWYLNGGSNRIMTISNNGQVSVNNDGNIVNGWYGNGFLTFGYEQSTITRTGNNGIRTYNRTTGETSNYSSSGFGGGGGGGGGNFNRPPNWAVGTWYWNGGRDRIMTISSNGELTVNANGNNINGRYSNGMLVFGSEQSTLTRTGNGIQTYNRSTGETSNYSSSGFGGGGNFNRPPNWAVGTWYWNGGRKRIMTISANGQATVNANGTLYNGNYINGFLVFDGQNSTLTRIGNGIRTYNQSTGETSNYSSRRN